MTVSEAPDQCSSLLIAAQVKYWQKPGNSGFFVYQYRLRRRPNQGELFSKALVFGGGAAPKDFTAESRKKEVYTTHTAA